MLSTLTELLKNERHQRGSHVLLLGSACVLRPMAVQTDRLIENEIREWAGDRVTGDDAAREAQALFAQEVADGRERAAVLRPALAGARPAEGHIRLAQLIRSGYFTVVFSCSVDSLLDESLKAQKLNAHEDYVRLVVGHDRAEEIKAQLRESTRIVLLKLLGDVEVGVLPVTEDEIREHLAPVAQLLGQEFRKPTTCVEYADRDAPILELMPREGRPLFWVSRRIPMADEALYEQLRVESPTSVYYHDFRPDVIELLRSRRSETNLLVRDAGAFDQFFARVIRQLGRRSYDRIRKTPTLTMLPGGPYRFLDFFDVKDADIFHGRDEAVDEVCHLVEDSRMVVLFGASGVGKTSLLRAGLMGRLQKAEEEKEGSTETRRRRERRGQAAEEKVEGPKWVPVYARCGYWALDNLRQAARDALAAKAPDATIDGDASLPDLLEELGRVCGLRVLVLLDQFEEFFVRLGPGLQEQLGQVLAACVAPSRPRVHLVLTVDETHFSDLYEVQSYIPEVFHRVYRLRSLTGQAAHDAIVKPATYYDVQVEPEAADAIVDDLDRDGIDPAELQTVCHRLYEALGSRRHLIVEKDYAQLGRAEKLLAGYVEPVLAKVPKRERETAHGLLKQLVGHGDLGASATVARLAHALDEERPAIERAVARLLDARALRAVEEGDARRYELIHPRLVPELREAMTEDERTARGAQLTLERWALEHERFGALIPEQELAAINAVRDDLVLSRAELELIIRSAVAHGVDAEYWLDRVPELDERQFALLRDLLHHEDPDVRETAVQGLASTHRAEAMEPLIEGLSDEIKEVRESAAEGLEALDRELVNELKDGEADQRRRAAFALGKIHSRRALRPLVEALQEGDDAVQEEATAALEEIHNPKAADMLLKRLVSDAEAPWSAAYALGRIAPREGFSERLARAAKQRPESPQLAYALGRALAMQDELPAAREALGRAGELVRTPAGEAAVREALEGLDEAERRASVGDLDWAQLYKNSRHTGHTLQKVWPPLDSRWSFRAEEYIAGSVTVVAGQVFVGCRAGRAYALDALTGDQRWRFDADGWIEATPAYCAGRVLFGTGEGTLYAVDSATGKMVWRQSLGRRIRSSCCTEGDLAYVATWEGVVHAVLASSGERHFARQLGGEVAATPAAAGGLVLVGCWDHNLYALDVETGEPTWTFETGGPIPNSPAIEEENVYFGSDDGHLYALELATGKLVWKQQIGTAVRSSPAVTRETVFTGSLGGAVVACKADTGEEQWRFQADDDIASSPSLANDLLFVGSRDGYLYAIDAATGEERWHYRTAYAVVASPAIYNEMVYLPLNYYEVHAFGAVQSVSRQGTTNT